MSKYYSKNDYREKLFQLMSDNGVFNKIQADYISDVAEETSKSDIDEIKSFDDLPDDKANFIASQVVVNYLERLHLNSTINAASSESFNCVERRASNEWAAKELNIDNQRNLLSGIIKEHTSHNLPPTVDSEEISTIITEIMVVRK